MASMCKRIKFIFTATIFCVTGLISLPSLSESFKSSKIVNVTVPDGSIPPALELLTIQKIKQNKIKNDLLMLERKIQKNPSDASLLYKKSVIYADQGDWNNAQELLNKIKLLQPDNADANKLRKIVEEKKCAEPHNQIGFNLDKAYVSDLKKYWNYSSIHYYRLTNHGKFGGHLNYANRFDKSEFQYQLEAYPKFSKNIFASLTYSYAKKDQILFPTYQYLIEGYIDVAYGFEFSLGQNRKHYAQFSNQDIFDYTGTIGKYIGDSFIWFRPHYYKPRNVLFCELAFRHYFSNSDNYITLSAGVGKLPDIGDLPPLDRMIVLDQKSFGFNGQVSITKTLFFKYGAWYAKQIFPSGLKRRITDVNIGMVWEL